jgi:hypothetical protein
MSNPMLVFKRLRFNKEGTDTPVNSFSVPKSKAKHKLILYVLLEGL